MEITNKIPSSAIQATVALLTPYVADISPTSLIKALKSYDCNQVKIGKLDTLKPLTIKETAEYLGVSKVTINRFLNLGVLQRVKLSRKTVRITAESIKAYIQGA